MPLTETAVARRFWDAPEKVAPMLTLLALRACRFSQACREKGLEEHEGPFLHSVT